MTDEEKDELFHEWKQRASAASAILIVACPDEAIAVAGLLEGCLRTAILGFFRLNVPKDMDENDVQEMIARTLKIWTEWMMSRERLN